MNTSQWIEKIIASKKRFAMPIMTHPGIELLGKSVLDAVTDGEVHFNAIAILNREFPESVACTSIMDLTVEAEAFGAELHMSDNEIPTVVGHPLTCYDEVRELQIPSLDVARIPQFLKADSLGATKLDKPFFAGCTGPYSLAGRLFGMTEILMAIYTEPQTVSMLLEKCTDFLINYCKAIKSTGVAGVIIAEPAAGLLSNEDCLQYSSVYVNQIVKAVQDDSFMVVLHNCGNTGHCTSAMLASGARGLHFGNKVNMKDVLDACPQDVLIMGNLDPVSVLKIASDNEVFSQTMQLLDETSSYPNFALSTGCDTPPEIPFDNIKAFYKALETYNEAI